MSDQSVLLPKWFNLGGITLAKGRKFCATVSRMFDLGFGYFGMAAWRMSMWRLTQKTPESPYFMYALKHRQLQNQSPQPLLVKCAIAERLRREQKTLSIVVATTCSHACSETINQTLKKENCYRLMMTMASFLPLFTLLKINDPIEYWQIDIPE